MINIVCPNIHFCHCNKNLFSLSKMVEKFNMHIKNFNIYPHLLLVRMLTGPLFLENNMDTPHKPRN